LLLKLDDVATDFPTGANLYSIYSAQRLTARGLDQLAKLMYQ